jgi:hypothetical protein
VEQLTTLDAGFLEAEDSDRHASLAIGAWQSSTYPLPITTRSWPPWPNEYRRFPGSPRSCACTCSTSARRNGSTTSVLILPIMYIGGRFCSRAMTPRCSDWSPKSWNVLLANVVPGLCDSLHVDRTTIAGAASRAVGPLPAASALSTQRAPPCGLNSGEIVDCECSAISVTVGAQRSTSSNSRSATP